MDQQITATTIKMAKAIDILKHDLGTIRAGRANASLIDSVRIKAYGGTQELSVAEMATISQLDATTLVVTPFDSSILDELERGLQQANLGISIASDGEKIRVTVPPMSEERRKEFAKLAKVKTESVRVMLRQMRQEAINSVRDSFQKKEIAEDEKFRLEKEIQLETDQHVGITDTLLQAKTQELETI